MITIVFHPDFVERVVFEAARADGRLTRRYQREFSACYGVLAGDARDQAFRELHERWFDELGFRDRIQNTTAQFHHVKSCVARLAVIQAGNANLQSAELFGKPGRFTVVVTVAVPTLLNESLFDYWVRHELLHIDDMLDPAFQYDMTARPSGPSLATRNLGRDRYALLWAISIDARLAKKNRSAQLVKPQRCRELALAWGLSDLNAAEQAFELLWTKFDTCRPTHHDMLDLTHSVWSDGNWSRDQPLNRCSPSPGDPCPVCKFHTFDWALQSQLQRIQHVVNQRLPAWRPEDGLCGRCAEVYAMEAPKKSSAGV